MIALTREPSASLADGERTFERVVGAGFAARVVDVGEFAKAEGSLTCLSLLFEENGGSGAG